MQFADRGFETPRCLTLESALLLDLLLMESEQRPGKDNNGEELEEEHHGEVCGAIQCTRSSGKPKVPNKQQEESGSYCKPRKGVNRSRLKEIDAHIDGNVALHHPQLVDNAVHSGTKERPSKEV